MLSPVVVKGLVILQTGGVAERHSCSVPRLDPRAVGNCLATKAIDPPGKAERNPRKLVVPEAMVEEIPMVILKAILVTLTAMMMDSGFHDDASDKL